MELSRVRSRLRLSALCLLTCLAVLEFSARGPVRALGRSGRDINDFISPYTQTRLWLSGHDPYAPSNLRDLWPVFPAPNFLLQESVDGTLPAKSGLPSPYLDIAFPLLLPIARIALENRNLCVDFDVRSSGLRSRLDTHPPCRSSKTQSAGADDLRVGIAPGSHADRDCHL